MPAATSARLPNLTAVAGSPKKSHPNDGRPHGANAHPDGIGRANREVAHGPAEQTNAEQEGGSRPYGRPKPREAFGVLEATAVAVAVGRVIAVLVASGAGQRDGGQFLARAAARAVDGQEHQAAFFDRAHGVVLAGQAGQKVKIAFVGLVDVRHLDGGQGGVYARGQVVAPRDGVHGGVVPAALAAGAQLECIKSPLSAGYLVKAQRRLVRARPIMAMMVANMISAHSDKVGMLAVLAALVGTLN